MLLPGAKGRAFLGTRHVWAPREGLCLFPGWVMGMLTQQPPLHRLERRGTALGASRSACWGFLCPPRALIPGQAERCDRNLCFYHADCASIMLIDPGARDGFKVSLD